MSTNCTFIFHSFHLLIILPKSEYALVISEFNTNLSDEERTHRIVTKPIGEYYYTVINNGFNEYIVIGKIKIVDDVYDVWEDTYEE